jgi:DNA-binding CsgD family transcriptional regulator
MSIILPKNNLMLSKASDVESAISEIKHTHVNFYSFTRVYKDNSRIDFNNRADMASEFYDDEQKYYLDYTPEVDPQNIRENMLYLDNEGENKSVRFLKEKCAIDHMLIFLNKFDTYVDVHNFGMPPTTENPLEIYKRNLGMFEAFSFYFVNDFKKEIEKFEQDRIIILDENSEQIQTESNVSLDEILPVTFLGDFLNSVFFQRLSNIYISPGVKLPKRVFEMMCWIMRGKSLGEISVIMGISQNTVKKYLITAKQIMGVDHSFELINKIRKIPFFKKI